jgi:hypothetical protein
VTRARAKAAIDRTGIILVYPLDLELPSLWSELHPRSKMRWDWAETADPRVVELWHLREALARSGDVAYAKWFRGRATFFSLRVFEALLGRLAGAGEVVSGLPRESETILELLRERSPLSTKELRAAADLRGKAEGRLFLHAMKALWTRLLIVGVGEVEDSAFPSLAVAATETMFEDVWQRRVHPPRAATRELDRVLERYPPFARELARSCAAIRAAREFDAAEREG